MKKTYKTPELKTQKIELGVFGCYPCRRGPWYHGGSIQGGNNDFSPLRGLDDLGLTME